MLLSSPVSSMSPHLVGRMERVQCDLIWMMLENMRKITLQVELTPRSKCEEESALTGIYFRNINLTGNWLWQKLAHCGSVCNSTYGLQPKWCNVNNVVIRLTPLSTRRISRISLLSSVN